MLTKEKIMESIGDMPNEATPDQILERILYLIDLEEGLKDVKAGRVMTTEELKKVGKRWQK